MADIKNELLTMLNKGLELEQAARIQYLAHAEQIKGSDAERIIERLKEIASDEQKHEEMFRNLIAAYLGGLPSMNLAKTYAAADRKGIYAVNLKGEKEATDFYKQIYRKVVDNKGDLQYEFEKLEHDIRHIILDEEEHIVELTVIFG